jgi:hypothetical protein
MAKRHSALGLAAGFGVAGLHTAITLWYRFPMLAAAFASNEKPRPELTRMVSEKAAALVEGAFDAQVEMVRLAGAAAAGRLHPIDLANAPAAIASAAMRPAFRRVRANSRRLHRRRPAR